MMPAAVVPQASGGFVHLSPLAATQDPLVRLSSHCIRHAFGPTVQLVADALQTRGPMTFGQTVSYLRLKSTATDVAAIRASLLVLLQHDIVSCKSSKYVYRPSIARNLMRFAKYIEYLKKTDEATAAVAQVLLLDGRLTTMDWMVKALDSQHIKQDHRFTLRQQVVENVYKLVTQGFVHQVETLLDDEEAEYEPPKKKVRIMEDPTSPSSSSSASRDPAILSLLNGNAHYKAALPIDAVWRINIKFFHDYFQAFHLGRLVAERYGSKVQSCGSLVTAALKYRAQADTNDTFSPTDIIKFLPKPVQQIFEKRVGGLHRNLAKAWEDLCSIATHPIVVRKASSQEQFETRYRIATSSLMDYLQERVVHQLVLDRHGEVAARIISILSKQGFLESETLADAAMVPAKDTREILHNLYRSRYVELLQFSTRQQYNPANAVYLWGIHKDRLRSKATENVAQALWNIRVRRQRHLEVGKAWVERAQQAAETDENDHESDRLEYKKFCIGLERLDVAAMHLDDTLLVMSDYQINQHLYGY